MTLRRSRAAGRSSGDGAMCPLSPEPPRLLLSARGNVSLTSQTEDWELNAQGVLEGNALMLEYHLNFRDGTQDFGLMFLSR